MLKVDDLTIGEAFEHAVSAWPANEFMVVPKDAERAYYPAGWSCTYAGAARYVNDFAERLRVAGYGRRHRVAVLLENRPEMLLWKLACNTVGAAWVPINPDYRAAEMAYVLADSDAALVIVAAGHAELMQAALREAGSAAACVVWDDAAPEPVALPPARVRAGDGRVGVQSEASLLYTSGTTGGPKGCIMGHEYELMMGAWYAARGGRFSLREGEERVYNPLPLFHVNAGIAKLRPYQEMDEATFDEIMNVNVKGAWFTIARCAPVTTNSSASGASRGNSTTSPRIARS